MSRNVGVIDRAIRILLGLALIAYAIPIGFEQGSWNWVGWIGIIPLITGLVGTCPLYNLLGFDTVSHQ